MLPNLSKMLHLTRGQKSVIVAYAAVMAIAAGIAIMIMSAADGVYAVPAEPTWFDIWVIIAGGLASCAALYASRRWMGGRGAMGVARAVLAAIVVSLATAILAGALIVPDRVFSDACFGNCVVQRTVRGTLFVPQGRARKRTH